MYQVQDVLIPARFICFILQVLLTITIGFNWRDYIIKEDKVLDLTSDRIFIAELCLLVLCELIEFIILLTGYTLFSNLLSIMQIFLHSVGVLLLDWFIRDVWKGIEIISPFLFGGLLPVILEIIDVIIICSGNRKVTKIN